MAKKEKGYVKLYRDIQDHWLWQSDEPFSRGQAWIDLLLSVNHKDRNIRINNQIITVHAGQKWTSYKKLGRRWGWSYKRVLRFITLLTEDGMVYTNATPYGTLLTIVKWGDFQSRGQGGDTPYDTSNDTSDDTSLAIPHATSDDIQTRMIKNVKNDKNEKEKGFAGLIFPSAEDIANNPPRGGGEWE